MRWTLLIPALFLSGKLATAAVPQNIETVQRSLWIGAGQDLNQGYLVTESRSKDGRVRVRASHFDGHRVMHTKRLLADDFDPLQSQVIGLLKPGSSRTRPPNCGHPMMVSTQKKRAPMDRFYICVSARTRNVSRQMASVFADLK